jgi:hypothetical protein
MSKNGVEFSLDDSRARRMKILAIAGGVILAIAVAAVWTYGPGERTYYGPHTGILHTGDTVVVAEDFSVPGSTVVHSTTRGIVESDPAWDEDSCDPDRPISLRLASGELVSVPRHILHR